MTRGTFQGCCCQCPRPCGEPLLTHASTGDPPTLTRSFGSVFYGVTAPFLWVFVHTRFCLCPSRLESHFPQSCRSPIIKSHRTSRSDSLEIPSPLSDPQARSLMWGSETSQQWENFCGIIVLQFVGSPTLRV